jgi:hypothetical protein
LQIKEFKLKVRRIVNYVESDKTNTRISDRNIVLTKVCPLSNFR